MLFLGRVGCDRETGRGWVEEGSGLMRCVKRDDLLRRPSCSFAACVDS